MAEAIAALGIIASVAQLADYGFKLSLKLYTFSSAVSNADASIRAISSDVSLTSTVLKELCVLIENDVDGRGSHIVSEAAVEATRRTVQECLGIFGELEGALNKSMNSMGVTDPGETSSERGTKGVGILGKGKGRAALDKLKWPFKQPKMELFRCQLDRLKASLTLMLQVLSYARDVSSRKVADANLAYQQQLIERLARSERAMKTKYIALQSAIEDQSARSAGGFDATINTAVNTISSPEVTREFNVQGTSEQSRPEPSPDDYGVSGPIEPTSSPRLRVRTVVGELLLCFQLLNDLLGHHTAVTKPNGMSSMRFENLRSALKEIEEKEMKRLEADHADSAFNVRAEAARNIQTRLRELAETGVLKSRAHVEAVSRQPYFDSLPEQAHSGTEWPLLATSKEKKKKSKARQDSLSLPAFEPDSAAAVEVETGDLEDAKASKPIFEDDTLMGRSNKASKAGIHDNPNTVRDRVEYETAHDYGLDDEDDESDIEAATGLEAMRIAEEQCVLDHEGHDPSENPQGTYQLLHDENSDSDYKHMDSGLPGGGYDTHVPYEDDLSGLATRHSSGLHKAGDIKQTEDILAIPGALVEARSPPNSPVCKSSISTHMDLDANSYRIHKSIVPILQRGERLDYLQSKSDSIAIATEFYRSGARQKSWNHVLGPIMHSVESLGSSGYQSIREGLSFIFGGSEESFGVPEHEGGDQVTASREGLSSTGYSGTGSAQVGAMTAVSLGEPHKNYPQSPGTGRLRETADRVEAEETRWEDLVAMWTTLKN